MIKKNADSVVEFTRYSQYSFFYRSIVDLQYCVSFRCTAKWLGYMYTCICLYSSFCNSLYKILTIVPWKSCGSKEKSHVMKNETGTHYPQTTYLSLQYFVRWNRNLISAIVGFSPFTIDKCQSYIQTFSEGHLINLTVLFQFLQS